MRGVSPVLALAVLLAGQVSGLTTTPAPDAATTTPTTPASSVTPADLCPSTLCGHPSAEPLTPEVRELRGTTCNLEVGLVEAIAPNKSTNPPHVQRVESLVSEEVFRGLFPSASPAYTYPHFLKAVGLFPAFCKSEAACGRSLVALFAHFQQESSGLALLEAAVPGDHCNASLAFPCTIGQQYHGRGALMLTGNSNYGALSLALFGDRAVLLDQPDLVTKPLLSFVAGLWFFVTPQHLKPSMLQVMDGTWAPNADDEAANLVAGFGLTTLIISGEAECGPAVSRIASFTRSAFYTTFGSILGVDTSGSVEDLTCSDSTVFSPTGSAAAAAAFWDPANSCRLGATPGPFSPRAVPATP